MDNVIKKFFSNGIDDESLFKAYQGVKSENITNNTNYVIPRRNDNMTLTGGEQANVFNNTNPNPNLIPNLYANPNTMTHMAKTSPFMNLNKSHMIPQPNNVLEKTFPSFDNTSILRPKSIKYEQEQTLNEQKQINMKLQILEEKLRQSEAKRGMLDAINKMMVIEEGNKVQNQNQNGSGMMTNTLSTPADIDGQHQRELMAKEAKNVLKEIQEDIRRKMLEDSMKNIQSFANINNELKELKAEISDRFATLHNKHTLQVEAIKHIFNQSGSRRLKDLSKRILGDDVYDIGKMEYKFVRPSEEELDKATREVSRKNTERRKTRPSISPNKPDSVLGNQGNHIKSDELRDGPRFSLKKSPTRKTTKNDTKSDNKSVLNLEPNNFENDKKIDEVEDDDDDGERPKIKHKYVKN